jgi:hypothetical protein
MADPDFPAELVDLQRRANDALAALEAYRRTVDAARAADADRADAELRATGGRPVEIPSWGRRQLRPWTEEENRRFGELQAAVLAAQEARRAGIEASGLAHGIEVVQGLNQAARA